MGHRNLVITKTEAVVRYIMCHFMSAHFPLFIVTEYPKSGGSWFSQMLANALDIPFPRNEFPKLTSQVMHGHYAYHPRLKNVFCVIRDGRDVMVSYYYHSLFVQEKHLNAQVVNRTRRILGITDPEDIWKNLPRFIEYKFGGKSYPPFTWSEFVTGWLNKNVALVRYEDMLKDVASVLGQAISDVVGVDVPMETLKEIESRYSFANLAKRRPGQEKINSFLRKGIAGDWRNKFSPEAKRVFDHNAGETLIALGYEEDHTWAEQ